MRKDSVMLSALCLLFCLLLPASAFAKQNTVELNVNHETVEGALKMNYPVQENTVSTGYDAIYKEDEYRLMGIQVLIGDRPIPDLFCALGFRGIYGEVRAYPEDPTVSSVAFSGMAEYTFFREEGTFPVDLGAQVNVSPDPLSFDETENYWSVRSYMDFNILQTGGITAGYRYREADLEKRGIDRSYTEGSFFIGYKLSF